MAHFQIELNEDNTVRQILRDGVVDTSAVKLEQVYSVVTTYFRSAAANLNEMRQVEDGEQRRGYGLQAFLMSLTGLEAFTNTYFYLLGQQLQSPAIEHIAQTHGSLTKKISELISLTGVPELMDQKALLHRVFQLSALRNNIVHPRWVPSSLLLNFGAPIRIDGLVENPQVQFENEAFCRESLHWCLLLVARIGEARHPGQSDAFLFHWTGNYGMTLQYLLNELALEQ